MKNLLILATMLLTFGFANAQSKIYQKLSGYNNYQEIGKCESGKIYQKLSGYNNYQEVGKFDGCGGPAAYLILLFGSI